MFFCPELLRKKGHPFFLVWMAATQRDDRLKKYLTPRKAIGVDINHVVNDVLKRIIVTSSMRRQLAMQNGCFSLYLSAQLMYGCCVVLRMKAAILISDLNTISKNVRKMRFSSEKSQMVVQCPKKSRKKESAKTSSDKLPDASSHLSVWGIAIDDSDQDLTFMEILPLDDDGEAFEFTHSVPARSITLQESTFPIADEEDTRFGDEGDGGQAFINFINGNRGQISEIQLHDDEQPQPILSEPEQPSITRRLSEDQLMDTSVVPPEQLDLLGNAGGKFEDPVNPIVPPEQLDQMSSEVQLMDTSVVPPEQLDLLGNAGGKFEDPVNPVVPPEQLDQMSYGGGLFEDFPDNMALVVLPVPERSITLEENTLPIADGEDTHFGDERNHVVAIPNFMNGSSRISEVHLGDVDQPQPILSEPEQPSITRRLSEAQLTDTSVVPPEQLDLLGNAGGIFEDPVNPVVSPEQLNQQTKPLDTGFEAPEEIPFPVIPEESNTMELPELQEVPEVKRKRKRHSHLIIDEKINIPPSTMQKRIDDEAKDTLRNETPYEDAMVMSSNAKWLNLSAMTQQGKSGPLNRSLSTMFSLRCVTHSEPNDDLDQTFNQTIRMESPPAFKSRTKQNDTTRTMDGSVPDNADCVSLEGQKEISAPLISTTPQRSFDEILQDLSTTQSKRGRFDSVCEPLDSTPPGLKEIRPGPSTDQSEKPDSAKRSLVSLPAFEPDSRENDSSHIMDGSVPVNADLHQSFEGQNETVGKLISSTPQRMFDDFFPDLSTPPSKRGRFDSVCDPIVSDPLGLGVPSSPVRTREEPPSAKRQRLSEIVPVASANKEYSGLEDATVEAGNEDVNVLDLTDGLRDFIPSEGIEDPGLIPTRLGRQSDADVPLEAKGPEDAASDSSVISSGPLTSEDVLNSAIQLARKINNNTVSIADLCPPPSRQNRSKAAQTFSILLGLHKKTHVTLIQNRPQDHEVDPISLTVNVPFSPNL